MQLPFLELGQTAHVCVYELKKNLGTVSRDLTITLVKDLGEEIFVFDRMNSLGIQKYLSTYYTFENCFFYKGAKPEESIFCLKKKTNAFESYHPDAIATSCNPAKTKFTIYFKMKSGKILSTTFFYPNWFQDRPYKVKDPKRLQRILEALDAMGSNKDFRLVHLDEEKCSSKSFEFYQPKEKEEEDPSIRSER
eukprot:GHVP01043254.1.p1 GENE.GHVP01043254.1~~GHVP01043254.1.p1  ORF type:complete len:193 (-),score=32.28 GHVP01043254.1:32-610(-)